MKIDLIGPKVRRAHICGIAGVRFAWAWGKKAWPGERWAAPGESRVCATQRPRAASLGRRRWVTPGLRQPCWPAAHGASLCRVHRLPATLSLLACRPAERGGQGRRQCNRLCPSRRPLLYSVRCAPLASLCSWLRAHPANHSLWTALLSALLGSWSRLPLLSTHAASRHRYAR